MKCKGCSKQLNADQEGLFGLCQSCWDELCDATCWEHFDTVAEGAD